MLRILTAILIILFSYNASATTTLDCNNCTSYTNYFTKAYDKASALSHNSYSGFSGDIVVINPFQNKAYGWYVSTRWIMQGGDEPELVVNINSINVPSNIIEATDTLSRSDIVVHLKAAKQGIEVPIDSGFDSAWKIAQNSQSHSALDDWYHGKYPLGYWTRAASDIIAQVGLLPDFLKGIEVKFIFSDKSSARFKLNAVQTGDLEFVYIPNTAKTEDGVRIADQGISFNGEYDFGSEEALQDFLNKALAYGIELNVIYTNGSGGAGGGSVTIREIPKKKT